VYNKADLEVSVGIRQDPQGMVTKPQEAIRNVPDDREQIGDCQTDVGERGSRVRLTFAKVN